MTVENKLRTIRLQSGMSLVELAERASVSKGYVSQLETGHARLSSMSLTIAKRLSMALGVEMDAFLSPISLGYSPDRFEPRLDDIDSETALDDALTLLGEAARRLIQAQRWVNSKRSHEQEETLKDAETGVQLLLRPTFHVVRVRREVQPDVRPDVRPGKDGDA